MADVFISYSRKDTEFVRRLHEALAARGRDAWVDWEDIPLTADWWREVTAGIEAADTFIFIISPDSVRSEICRKEVDHAVANNKRLVPILRRPTPEAADQKAMHPSIGTHNWVFFREIDDFKQAFEGLMTALDTDLGHVRQHTRLLVRAKEWKGSGENPSFLLQGVDLKQAEDWLAQGVAKKPAPTALHAEYITASRAAASRRQRALLAGVSVALVVAVGLALLSLLLYGESNVQRGIAEEKSITATVAQGVAQIEAENAQTQAARAENNAATATFAQGEAEFERNNAQTQAARAENNAATATFAQGEAEFERNNAQTQATAVANERNRAQSIALAGQAQLEFENEQPERAVLIALHALQAFTYTWQAERALGVAMQNRLERVTLAGDTAYTSVDWSPDGARLVTAGNDGDIRIWDDSGVELDALLGHTAGVIRALWSPDGAHIASAGDDDTARIWDAQTGDLLFTFSGHTDALTGLDWSPDGTRLVTSSVDDTARIWDTQTGDLLFTLSGHTGDVNGVDWSPSGGRIVTASADGTAKIWDAATGEVTFTLSGHEQAIYRALWSPDGTRILTVSDDSTGKLWNPSTGVETAALVGHVRGVTRAAWSPDGARIVTISRDDTARLWNTSTGTARFVLYGHTSDLTGAAWSPDGRRVVTISRDATTRVWNANTGAQLLVYAGHNDLLYSVAWSADGGHIATAGEDNTARIWGIWASVNDLVAFAQECCVTRPLTDEESSQFGIPRASSQPPPAEIPACPEALPSRLYGGVRGQVTPDDNLALNVRAGPTLAGRQIGQISPNRTFWVVDGPECADGIAWFQVIYGINAARGWVAEGVSGKYFTRALP